MNKKQTNRFRMIHSTQMHMDNHPTIWSGVGKIVEVKNNIDELVTRVELKSDVVAGMMGVTERKDAYKEIIAVKGSLMAGKVLAFANASKDKDLAKKVKVNNSKTEILEMKEEDIGPYFKFLTDTATKNVTELADYGLIQESVTELLTTVDELNVLIGQPRIMLNSKYVELEAIDELLHEASELMNEQLDNLMLMFRESHPEFYSGYKRARVIIDL